MKNSKVLIVGAGPTGLTAAIELARRGIVAEVIDRKEAPSALSRAVGIMPSSLRTLEPSGVAERIEAEGVRLGKMVIYRGVRRLLSISLDNAHPDRDYFIALAQDKTEEAMRDGLARYGGSVNYGTELVGLRQEGNRVIAELADGRKSEHDCVLGADGVRSATRSSLGLEFPGIELPQKWSIADVDAKNWRHPECFTLSLLPQGDVVVVAPLEEGRFRLVSNTDNALEALPFDLDVTQVRREAQFAIAVRQVREYKAGRVFLAGDAAHCHSPVGGRGMNLGIADAAEFARRLADDQLDGYSASRHVYGKKTIALSERGRKLTTLRNPIGRAMLVTGLRLIHRLPPVQRRIARIFLEG